MPNAIVVTGCDANHHDLAADLLASLKAITPRPFATGFINIGAGPLPEAIASAVDAVVEIADEAFAAMGGRGFRLGYLGVKPSLPRLFPGYDIYVWMDADTWVQNAAGLDAYLHCARLADIAAAPESDRSYFQVEQPSRYLLEVYNGLLGPEAMHAYGRLPMINTGVFSAVAASPLWAAWEEALRALREAPPAGAATWFSDQIPLHRLVHSGALTLHPLSAVNNWLVSMRPPSINTDTGRVCAPTWPHEEINIIHLTGASKDWRFPVGGGGDTSLRYSEVRARFAPAGEAPRG